MLNIKRGDRVRVYYNLHKHLLSVTKDRLVVGHTASILLSDVRFVVSEAGRQRVLREKRKNVHAFVEGTVCGVGARTPATAQTVRYNPYEGPLFTCAGQPITAAARVVIKGKRVYVR